MLNTKLREEKRINKIKKSMVRKEKKAQKNPKKAIEKKGKSKFSNKYSERIASIKQADEKLKLKNNERYIRNERNIKSEEKRRE